MVGLIVSVAARKSCRRTIFDKRKLLATSRWLLARKPSNLNHKGHPFDSFALLSRSGQAVDHEGKSVKPTPNWDHLGWGGIPREGGRSPESPPSPRSGRQNLPLIDTDDTDQEPIAEVYANLGCPGMTWDGPGGGGGGEIAKIAEIAKIGN
jgi:hypothetical protein